MIVFIELAYSIRGWIVSQWLSAAGELGKPAQSKKLGVSEQEAEGLEAPWRISGVNPSSKMEESRV
jgi:hypothetical protein